MKKLLTIARIILPVILLVFIITKIDFPRLIEVYGKSNKLLLVLAFISFPLSYALFSLRWKIVLNMFGYKSISYLRLLKTVYIGFFSGYFLPASVGIDIFRVVSLRKTKTTAINIGLIFQEKLMGLLVCGFLIVCFSGLIKIEESSLYLQIRNVVYLILTLTLLILFVMLLFKKSKFVNWLMGIAEKRLSLLIKWFAMKFKKDVKLEDKFIRKVLHVSLLPKMILIVALFGLLNQFIGAVFSNVAFHAMGANIPLSYNLFANPLLNIIFLFPISFGGFGIREGSYILVFGLLGVTSEISLLVSFVFLISTLINVAIGGLILMFDKKLA